MPRSGRGFEVAHHSTAAQSSPLSVGPDENTPRRFAASAVAGSDPAGPGGDLGAFRHWFDRCHARSTMTVRRVPLDELAGWHTDPDTGDITHDSGRFFTVGGLEVHLTGAPVPTWSQPILNQPEVGILGILVKEFDGVPHLLMQGKVEPGNALGLQLSPTVQATRSNYTRVHGGSSVPYLELFRDTARHRVLADVRQSEQGAWFRQKRNRNMIVEVTEDVPELPGFHWLTLGQVHRLLAVEDLINMDARTVLACLPFAGSALDEMVPAPRDAFHAALLASCDADRGSLHSMAEVLSWVTDVRTRTEVATRELPLAALPDWHRVDGVISHSSGRFFDVIGVDVRTRTREVPGWSQPMIAAKGIGLVAFLVARVHGVLHALVHARAEPGYLDVVELAPTVQCTPDNYLELPAAALPRFVDEALSARPEQIRYRTLLSEEGGRFYQSRNTYTIVEVERDRRHDHPDFRWMPVHQLVDLLRHSHYVNVQARTLVACLHSLTARPAR
ncbi:oxidase EvaA [Nocardia pseudobrasiliensis]|uniref:Oxidase EvaA n=1 Tax=Nocardia pseudobrasiliensis TaxID=45979 RepID=A0A370HW35_9NOCA|nr:oxidase EvaA [Nocardia pseudobrasiliensis]